MKIETRAAFEKELTKAIKGASWIARAGAKLIALYDDGAMPPENFEEKLRRLELDATDGIASLRKRTGFVRNPKVVNLKQSPET
jgi:hypothetical protein